MFEMKIIKKLQWMFKKKKKLHRNIRLNTLNIKKELKLNNTDYFY